MKILLSAIACDPHRGSEAHFGWNALKALSRDHEVWVLGHAKDTEAIQKAQKEGFLGSNVHFFPHSSWGNRSTNRIISRIQNWRDYQHWNWEVLPTAKKLEREIGFDVAHHVTLSTWRVPSQLWRLRCPFIWGPIGGAEVFPLHLLPMLSPPSAAYEMLRRLQNRLAMASPELRACVRNAAHIFTATPETRSMMLRLGCPEEKLSMLSAAFFTSDQIKKLQRPREFSSAGVFAKDQCLILFAGGDIEGRKGHALALHALAKCRTQGLKFHYHIAGQGPEVFHLQRLAVRLGISDSVIITPPLQGDEYMETLWKSHVYLLPSLRDNSPVTLMEAMLAGCFSIVADCGGPALIVDKKLGGLVPTNGQEAMVQTIAEKISKLFSDWNLSRNLGEDSRKKIRQKFSEANYVNEFNRQYRKLTDHQSVININKTLRRFEWA